MTAPLPANEARRVARLHALSVLDTDAEPLFDALTRIASQVTGAPMALISLIDSDRQWFKSSLGLEGISETPRDVAFCAYTILGTDLLEVHDARQDERFADNPLVTGAPDIRFYAGVPITLDDGLNMGSICVIDREPRALSETQQAMLKSLAEAVAEALELRMLSLQRQRDMEHEAERVRQQMANSLQLQRMLAASEAFLDRTGRLAGVGGWEGELDTGEITWSSETCRIHDVAEGFRPTMEEALGFYAPEAREQMKAAMEKATADGTGWDLELPFVTATGRKIWVRAVGEVEYHENGKPWRLVGAFQDISIRKRVVAALEASDRRFRQLFQYSLGLICTHDHDGVLYSVNPAAASSLGYSVGELLGRPLTDFMRPARHPAFRDYLLRVITRGTDAGVLELIGKDGAVHYWQYHNVLDDEGEDPYILGHAQDITERYQHERKLRDWSTRDPLTGCLNRRYLAELTDPLQESWGCIAIDLDHFKQVNDTYGHQRGDEVLVAMSRYLTEHVRPGDAVVRAGGDEFLLLLRGADAEATGKIVARIEQDRATAPIGFSLGVATFGNGVPLKQALADADRQLYATRAQRRG